MAGQCPKCGSKVIRRASSWWRHWGRVLVGSTKRHCVACGEKWHIEPPVARELLKPEERLIGAFALSGLIILAVATHPYFLRDWIKTQVRAYYDNKYGAESQEHLWHDLGWMYGGGQKAAANDYGTHYKKK